MNYQNRSLFGWDEQSGISRAGADKFPNPFYDIASQYVPTELNEIFEACEALMLITPPFRTVSQRVVRYFLTDLELEGQSDEDKEKCEDFLKNKLHIMQQLAEIGDDYLTYGQSFVSIYFPFNRILICPNCHTNYLISKIKYKFDNSDGSFIIDCNVCNSKSVKAIREDQRSTDVDRVKLIRWNPKDIRIRVHPISGRTEYYLNIDSNFVRKINEGNPFYLNDTPWTMVETCIKSGKTGTNNLFLFRPESIYHLRCGSLAGLPIKGWAIPPILPNFKLAYYVQLLRRYDEAIALDFIIPFRVLFPANSSPGGDALSTISMANFIGNVQAMINAKRKNMTDLFVMPFSVGYQMLGGEAKALSPKENIALAMDELLNSMGYPAELYKGTLSIQAFPVALRLFEKQWNSLVDGFNDLISWILSRLCKHFMWGEITGRLRSVTLADDLERKALALQAAAGMDISKQTAYKPLGIDYLEEQRRVTEEQEAIQRLQQEAMERQQAQTMNLGSGQGQEGGPGGEPGATPGDVHEQAKALAKQLLLQTPETLRRGELIKIKHSNPTLHALVLQEMDNMRQEMARQGQAMMMEQAKQAEAVDFGELKSLPSPTRIGLLISDQITEYNKGDLMKIAMDIRNGVVGARDAFHYIYPRILGWE